METPPEAHERPPVPQMLPPDLHLKYDRFLACVLMLNVNLQIRHGLWQLRVECAHLFWPYVMGVL